MFKKLVRTAACVAVISTPLLSAAAPVIYTSQASFLAAVSNAATDTFDDLTIAGVYSSPLGRTAGGYSYNASANGGFFPAASASDVWLATNFATDPITFDAFTGGIAAVGGYFFNSDINGDLQSGFNITVTATDASGTASETISNTTPTSFVGFLSTGLISSVTVTADNANAPPYTFATVNDLILAQGPSTQPPPDTSVPEPGSLALVAVAAAALGVVRRRRV